MSATSNRTAAFPDCGALPGHLHIDDCDIDWCSVCEDQSSSRQCEGHEPRATNWTEEWQEPEPAGGEWDGRIDPDERVDLARYDEMDPELLARVLYNGKFLGIGWKEAEPNLGDPLYARCLVASRAALDGLWTEESPPEPGEPVEPPVTSHVNVYAEVYQFAFLKTYLYYGGTGQGISTSMYRWQCRLGKAAARRAVASLFGEEVMGQAERDFERLMSEEKT